LTEALIDIRVSLPDSVTLDKLATIEPKVATDYPKRRSQFSGEFQFSAGPSSAASVAQRTIGFAFGSADDRQLFQARLDGFTFNRLAPYERWETFRDEARRLWGVYRATVAPEAITRVAVRYINRLDLPSSLHDFADYLSTYPQIAESIDSGLSGFLMRLEMPQTDINSVLILSESLVPAAAADHDGPAVVLDIDLFRVLERSVVGDDELWEILDVFRSRKNKVFEACITDKTRGLIS